MVLQCGSCGTKQPSDASNFCFHCRGKLGAAAKDALPKATKTKIATLEHSVQKMTADIQTGIDDMSADLQNLRAAERKQEDGGQAGTIVKVRDDGKVAVRWDASGETHGWYSVGQDGKFHLSLLHPPPKL